LDLTIDGADEIDAKGRMIKGGGANLLWEKNRRLGVAQNGRDRR